MNPQGEKETTLQKIAFVDSGQGAPQGEKWYGGKEIFVKAGDLNFLSDGKYVGDYCNKITSEAISKYKLKKYKKNSIVFPKSGMSIKTNNIAILKYDSFVVNHLAIIQVNNDETLAKYLYYLLKAKEPSKLSLNEGYPSIRINDLKRLKIFIPPRNQLSKIVSVLEKAEKLREWRKQSDKLTQEYLCRIFMKIFGDPRKKPGKFEFIKLKSAFSKSRPGLKCGPFGSALKKYEYVQSGIPVWTMDNISNGVFSEKGCLYITKQKYNELSSYSVENNDIIISRAGTVGKMCVVKTSAPKSIISTNLIRLSLDETFLSPIFFVCLMNYFKGRIGRLKTGPDGAYTFMNTSVLADLEIPRPPKELQSKYESIYLSIQKLTQLQQNTNLRIDNLSNLLMKKAFKGDLVC